MYIKGSYSTHNDECVTLMALCSFYKSHFNVWYPGAKCKFVPSYVQMYFGMIIKFLGSLNCLRTPCTLTIKLSKPHVDTNSNLSNKGPKRPPGGTPHVLSTVLVPQGQMWNYFSLMGQTYYQHVQHMRTHNRTYKLEYHHIVQVKPN